ncbi:MAG: hypothetical protein MUE39_09335 [Gammaproteobacteria bacterium]|jgi:hypothetical protein|nr:hypothetical protein [Gammaproteobacteria bacterium]
MNHINLWRELPVEVEFAYQPAEPAERGPEAQYPGCAESVEIEHVWFGRVELTGELTSTELDALAAAVLAELRERWAA